MSRSTAIPSKKEDVKKPLTSLNCNDYQNEPFEGGIVYRSAKISDQNGAALVEFAIVLPVLFMLIFGMIEFSVMLYDKAMITNASREGARAGIVYSYPAPITTAEITQRVNDYLQGHMISLGGPSAHTVAVSGQCTGSGDPLTVTVTYPYNFLVLPNFIQTLSGTITLSAQTTMRCE
jgi:Flp pilus assembly protein TadG